MRESIIVPLTASETGGNLSCGPVPVWRLESDNPIDDSYDLDGVQRADVQTDRNQVLEGCNSSYSATHAQHRQLCEA